MFVGWKGRNIEDILLPASCLITLLYYNQMKLYQTYWDLKGVQDKDVSSSLRKMSLLDVVLLSEVLESLHYLGRLALLLTYSLLQTQVISHLHFHFYWICSSFPCWSNSVCERGKLIDGTERCIPTTQTSSATSEQWKKDSYLCPETLVLFLCDAVHCYLHKSFINNLILYAGWLPGLHGHRSLHLFLH